MGVSTILLLALIIGISMYSRYARAIVVQSVPEDDSADDVLEQKDSSSEEEEIPMEDNPYFTYESDTADMSVNETREEKPQSFFVTAVEEPVRPQFDLRQAVVSQVILTNKYIDEINQ